MKLKKLTIERLPGIRKTLELELPDNRVAVVIGANASGKSSLIRALKALLERKPKNDDVHVTAEFEDDGQRIEGRAMATSRTWLIDGKEAERPDWPDAEQLDAYLIRADDLVDPGQSEEAISTALKQTLSGGIDLDGLINRAPFKSPPRPAGFKRKLDQVDQAIRTVESSYNKITIDFDGLDELRNRHQESAEAERRLSLLARALEWVGIRQQIELTQTALAQFPRGMDRLSGNENETLAAIEDEQVKKQSQLDSQQRQLAQAQQQLLEQQIEDIDQSQVWRDDLAELQTHLQQASTRLRELNEQRASAEAKLKHAADRSGGVKPESVRNLSPERLNQIESGINSLLGKRNEANHLREAIELRTQHSVDADHADRIDQAVAQLRKWLATPPAGLASSLSWAVLFMAAAAAGVWFWTEQQIWPAIVSAVASLLPLSHLIDLGLRASRGAQIKQATQALNVEPIAQWRSSNIQQRLRELETEQAQIERHRANLNDAEAFQFKLEKTQQLLTELEHQFDQLADQVGLDPEVLLNEGLSQRLRGLYDWQQAESYLHELNNKIRAVETTIHGLLGTTKRCLLKLQPEHEDPIEAILLESQLKRIDRRLANARELRQKIQALENSSLQTQADIETLIARRRRVFDDAGLEGQNEAQIENQLRHRLERLDDYIQANTTLRAIELTAQGHELALTSDAELTNLAMRADESSLLKLQLELQEQAEQRETIKEQILDIEHQHDQAMQARELEGLLSERETLRRQLFDALDQQRMASAGQFLLKRIQKQQHQQHQPALLKLASHWFSRFTRSRYQLKFDGQRFSAEDNQQGQTRSIAELSTATRVQLKLALRLAWIDQLDAHRPALPIILDEVLATSDPERYEAVVEAAQELVREGRQVVYLSAQPMDAQAWQHFADEPKPAIIKLGTHAPDTTIEFGLVEPDELPSATLDATDWAKQAGVVAIDPWQSYKSIDTFHLLRDRLQQLNDLRQRSIRSLGQLEHAMSADMIDADDELMRRIAGVKQWLQRWRLAQTPPIDTILLAGSGQIADRYIEGIDQICKHVNGQAEQLIKTLRDSSSALKVSGFGPTKIDALETWLSEQGYLDQPEPAHDYELVNAITQSSGMGSEQAAQLHGWLNAGLKQKLSKT